MQTPKTATKKKVEIKKEKPIEKKAKWVHRGYKNDSIVQKYVEYALKISGGNKDFVLTLNAENGLRNPHRQSNVPDKRGRNGKEDSWGFCQLHRRWHSKIVDDKRFWDDPFRQLDKCWEKYKGGTKFYGYYHRNKGRRYFNF